MCATHTNILTAVLIPSTKSCIRISLYYKASCMSFCLYQVPILPLHLPLSLGFVGLTKYVHAVSLVISCVLNHAYLNIVLTQIISCGFSNTLQFILHTFIKHLSVGLNVSVPFISTVPFIFPIL